MPTWIDHTIRLCERYNGRYHHNSVLAKTTQGMVCAQIGQEVQQGGESASTAGVVLIQHDGRANAVKQTEQAKVLLNMKDNPVK